MHSTSRLELSPMSADAIDALLSGDNERLHSLTNAVFPAPAKPPPYMAEALPAVRSRLRESPSELHWWNWLVVRRDTREAIGSVAFAGSPDEAGAVLIGYAMYPGGQGNGYATEATQALVEWAFTQPGVRIVRAMAPVWNTPAVHVAEKVGMRPVGSYEDDEVGEVLIYETARAVF
jgi:[ribosomal protein S5]-alanine N-acetyltransferase